MDGEGSFPVQIWTFPFPGGPPGLSSDAKGKDLASSLASSSSVG
jgi:hypothetical protein